MPVKRSDYPGNWEAIVAKVAKRAGGRCECTGECGLHKTTGGPRRCVERNGQPAKWAKGKIVLTTAHLCDCQPLCGNPEHLKHHCQRCHLRYDVPLHTRHRRERKERETGQMRLL